LATGVLGRDGDRRWIGVVGVTGHLSADEHRQAKRDERDEALRAGPLRDIGLAVDIDLAADKELKFEDLFKPGSDYKTAIAKYLTDDINRRAIELEKDEARRENRQPRKEDEPLISTDQLTEVSDFALTPKGIIVYFDFPHAIAYFDKNFVPYSVVKQYLKPNGPAAKFQ
jgi:hypothetical protein